jgi:N-acetylglucosaminyldiphosphoundecaprenol N-acetyl-beta-D-mannosaminyltransferase
LTSARPSIEILGVRVSAIDMDDAADTIENWIATRSRNYVCVTGAHGVIECRRNQQLRRIHNQAGLVTSDGMPLVWLSRILGARRTRRVYGPDLMRRLTEISARRGYRQFYYGGAPGVAEKLQLVLVRAHPDLNVVGTLCPLFRTLSAEEDSAEIARINAARPDILWVGLSTPKQELWMARHLGLIEAPVMVGVGAAFDFLAGTKRQAPRWAQRAGIEWCFRLCSEPRRLWRRYAYIVPIFGVLACWTVLRRALAMLRVARRLRAD